MQYLLLHSRSNGIGLSLLLLFASLTSTVVWGQGQGGPTCTQVSASAAEVGRSGNDACGCRRAPVCDTCRESGSTLLATCKNGCEYCAKNENSSNNGTKSCGTLQKSDAWTTRFTSFGSGARIPLTTYDTVYTWSYTTLSEGQRPFGSSIEYRSSFGPTPVPI